MKTVDLSSKERLLGELSTAGERGLDITLSGESAQRLSAEIFHQISRANRAESERDRMRASLERAGQRLTSLSKGRCRCQATAGYTHHCEACRALKHAEDIAVMLRGDLPAASPGTAAILHVGAERDRLRAALGRMSDKGREYDRNQDPTGAWAWFIDQARHALRTEDIIAANRGSDTSTAGLSMDETRFRAALFYAKPPADSPSTHRHAVRTAIESVWEHYERLKAEERRPADEPDEHRSNDK